MIRRTQKKRKKEAKPYNCPKCDKDFSTVDDGCKHTATIIDLDLEIFSSQTNSEEKSEAESGSTKKTIWLLPM